MYLRGEQTIRQTLSCNCCSGVVFQSLYDPRGNADANAVRRDISCHNGSSAYNDVTAVCHSRKNNAAVPEVDVISNSNRFHDIDLGILVSKYPNAPIVGFEVSLS